MASDDDFLARWARRKSEARRSRREGSGGDRGEAAHAASRKPDPVPSPRSPAPAKAPLPPVEALTPESDFSPFMSPEVDRDLRAKALKTLFGDPHFNKMDMLDVYVDDYSRPDPMPESWLARLEQASRLGDRAGRDREEAARAAAEAAPRTELAEADAAVRNDGSAGPAPSPSAEERGEPERNFGECPLPDKGHSGSGSC